MRNFKSDVFGVGVVNVAVRKPNDPTADYMHYFNNTPYSKDKKILYTSLGEFVRYNPNDPSDYESYVPVSKRDMADKPDHIKWPVEYADFVAGVYNDFLSKDIEIYKLQECFDTIAELIGEKIEVSECREGFMGADSLFTVSIRTLIDVDITVYNRFIEGKNILMFLPHNFEEVDTAKWCDNHGAYSEDLIKNGLTSGDFVKHHIEVAKLVSDMFGVYCALSGYDFYEGDKLVYKCLPRKQPTVPPDRFYYVFKELSNNDLEKLQNGYQEDRVRFLNEVKETQVENVRIYVAEYDGENVTITSDDYSKTVKMPDYKHPSHLNQYVGEHSLVVSPEEYQTYFSNTGPKFR